MQNGSTIRPASCRPVQDRGIAETGSSRSTPREDAPYVARSYGVQGPKRLGVREPFQ